MRRLNSCFGNQKGGALMMALVAAVALSLAALFAQQQAIGTEMNLRHLRLRSLLSVRESLARLILSQSDFYKCGGPKLPKLPVLNFSTCTVNWGSGAIAPANSIRGQIELAIPGCVLASGAASGSLCGIVVEPASMKFDNKTGTVSLRLMYNGQDAAFAINGTNLELPLDMLIAKKKNITCTLAKPFFVGLDKTGVANCEAFGGGSCGSHQYIRNLGKSTSPAAKNFVKVCKDLFSSPVSCAIGQYVNSYTWMGDDIYKTDCADFMDPFARWLPIP